MGLTYRRKHHKGVLGGLDKKEGSRDKKSGLSISLSPMTTLYVVGLYHEFDVFFVGLDGDIVIFCQSGRRICCIWLVRTPNCHILLVQTKLMSQFVSPDNEFVISYWSGRKDCCV